MAAVPRCRPALHTDDEDRAWLAASWRRPTTRSGSPSATARLVGYARLDADLARRPLRRARRTPARASARALLDLVKALRPDGFCAVGLRDQHPGARRFYARHGLVELERTDGSGNEEKAPDIRMAWPGADPLAFFRGLIDEVDEQLGDLLARRAALTRALAALPGAPAP